MLFLKLFLIFTKIGTFNFGGGYETGVLLTSCSLWHQYK